EVRIDAATVIGRGRAWPAIAVGERAARHIGEAAADDDSDGARRDRAGGDGSPVRHEQAIFGGNAGDVLAGRAGTVGLVDPEAVAIAEAERAEPAVEPAPFGR